jgi:hypothetical protein
MAALDLAGLAHRERRIPILGLIEQIRRRHAALSRNRPERQSFF